MILYKILDHDLHRARSSSDATPFMIETPAQPSFVPALVSTIDSGRFLVTRRLKDGNLRSGVFKHDSDKIDSLIRPILDAAYKMSVEEKYENVFIQPSLAFDHIAKTSGTGAHPHILLVPMNLQLDKFLGEHFDGKMYRKICKVISFDISLPVFFSRPDFVGLYTQFLGGGSSLFLHNVKNGLAFCTLPKRKKTRNDS